MKPDTQAVFPGDIHAAPAYDGSQCLGARLHYAYREAMGHIDRDQSLYAKFPADEQAFWNRAAVGFVARLSDAPQGGAEIRNALRLALAFAEDEVEDRIAAGGSETDYSGEAQDVVDTVRSALKVAESLP